MGKFGEFSPQRLKRADSARTARRKPDFALAQRLCFHCGFWKSTWASPHRGRWRSNRTPTQGCRRRSVGPSITITLEAGQPSCAALLSMNLQCWIQGFPWSRPTKPLSSTAVPTVNSQRMIKCWVGFNRPQMCDNWIYTCAVIKQYLYCIKLLQTGTLEWFFNFLHIINTSVLYFMQQQRLLFIQVDTVWGWLKKKTLNNRPLLYNIPVKFDGSNLQKHWNSP